MGEFLDKNFEDPEKSPNINNISILCNKVTWINYICNIHTDYQFRQVHGLLVIF